MALRPPHNPTSLTRAEAVEQALQHETLAEQAASLGYAGRRVEATLARIRDFDAGRLPAASRETLLSEAAYAVWSFLVQRELMGLRHQAEVVRNYQIPKEVLNRVGQSPRKG